MKTITYDDYLRLVGLLTLAADHRKALGDIERSAAAITGDRPEAGGHTSDAVWTDGYDAQRLMDLIEISVLTPPTPTTPPETAARQAAGAIRIVKRFSGELFPEE